MARKIASVCSRPERRSQQSTEATDCSLSAPASQKYTSSAATDTDESQVSEKEMKQTGFSNGVVTDANEEGPARQRAF